MGKNVPEIAGSQTEKCGFSVQDSKGSSCPAVPDHTCLSWDAWKASVGTAAPSLSLGKEGTGGMLETAALMSVPQPEDEEEEPTLEELEQREVLVLGLDGSGKSTFLRMLSGKPPLEGHVPTWGFNSVRLPTKNFEVDLLESERGTPSLLPRFFGGVYKTHI